MNKNIKIILGFALVIGIASVVYASMYNTTQKDVLTMNEKSTNNPVQQVEEMTKGNVGVSDAVMQKDGVDNKMNTSEVAIQGSYDVYSPDKIVRAETGDVILFFHASWCPSCRKLNSDIENNQTSIPQNVTILKVDYDAETELKKKYGVTSQHTLVQVDAQGNMIKKWSGGSKLNNIISQIQ